MNILVISHLYPYTTNPSFGIFVHEQVRALQKLGVSVQVLSPVHYAPRLLWLNSKWRAYGEIPRHAEIDGVNVFYPRTIMLPKGLLFSLYGAICYHAIKDLVDTIKKTQCFDLIHAHVAIPAGYAASLLKAKLKVPVVLTIHGLDLAETVHRSSRCRQNVLQAIRQVDQTVLVSHKLQRQLAALDNLAARNIMVFPNGVDPDKLQNAALNPYPTDKYGRKVLLSVGNLYHYKGHDLVLKALPQIIKEFPDVVYRIVGDGPEEGRLKALVQELDLTNHVVFMGRLPHIQALEHMAGCDIFVLPSWNEAFGVVYLEAMGLGKSVIGCRGEGVEDIVEDGQTGYLVEPRSTESLARTIIQLLKNDAASTRVAAAARDKVLSSFTWEQNARQYMDLYRRLIAKG